MFRFDERLMQIFREAKNRAIQKRGVEIINTIDFFTELIEDAESVLYSYISEENSEAVIADQLYELNNKQQASSQENYVQLQFNAIIEDNTSVFSVKVTRQLYKYILDAANIIVKYNDDTIVAEDISLAIVRNPTKQITKFFRSLKIDIYELKESMEEAYEDFESSKGISGNIPIEMQSYLSIVSGNDAILGRDKEIESSWNILSKKTKRNLILVGEPGVGKTAIISKMAAQIENGTAPEEFKDFKIYSLNVTAIVSGTKYRGDAEKRFMDLISFMTEKEKVILFIDEAHLIMGAGTAEGTMTNLSNSLKPLLASDSSRVIAATTNKEYNLYFSMDPAIKRRFEKVVVEEPNIYEVYPMIKAKIDELSEFHKVKISHRMVNFIALYASCFSYETKNPDRTLDLIDRSMVAAKRKHKKFVDKESVLSNFKVNIELFKDIPYQQKKETAYHEAGHYIAFSFLPYLKRNFKPVVVSIYPAEDYIGVTITEKRKNTIETKTKRAYLEQIAASLAGGIAESIVNPESNDGVSSDSEHATRLADALISQTGFYNDYFYNLDILKTEKSVEMDVERIKKIISEAKEIAIAVIDEHRKELEAVVKALLEKHVVSDEDLKIIMQKATIVEEEEILQT